MIHKLLVFVIAARTYATVAAATTTGIADMEAALSKTTCLVQYRLKIPVFSQGIDSKNHSYSEIYMYKIGHYFEPTDALTSSE